MIEINNKEIQTVQNIFQIPDMKAAIFIFGTVSLTYPNITITISSYQAK